MSEESTSTRRSGSAGLDIDNLFADIVKGAKKLFWIAVLGSITAALIFCSSAQKSYVPVYSSSATFAISISNSYGVNSKYYNAATAKQMALTFPYILNSGVLANLIKNDLGVPALAGTVSAEATEGVNLFKLTATSTNPQMAYNILESAVANYPQIADYVVGSTVLTLIDDTGIATEPDNSIDYKSEIIKGLLVGLVLYVIAIAFYALTRSTVRKSDDVKSLLNTRCICTVPKVYRKKRSRKHNEPLLLTGQSCDYGFREAFRLLRTRIEREEGQKVILVTSALANEGKTTVSVNLAISLATRGYKVLLIDCDISNPSVARTLGIKNDVSTGLLEYLENKAEASQIGMKIPSLGDLMVIAGRSRTDSSAELLDNGRMKQLIDMMKDYVDYIILDSSPSAILTDSTVLSKMATGSLFVIRQDYADRDSVIDGAENLAVNNLPMIGCVLNIAERTISRYNYGYDYSYGKRYNKYYGNYGKGE